MKCSRCMNIKPDSEFNVKKSGKVNKTCNSCCESERIRNKKKYCEHDKYKYSCKICISFEQRLLEEPDLQAELRSSAILSQAAYTEIHLIYDMMKNLSFICNNCKQIVDIKHESKLCSGPDGLDDCRDLFGALTQQVSSRKKVLDFGAISPINM